MPPTAEARAIHDEAWIRVVLENMSAKQSGRGSSRQALEADWPESFPQGMVDRLRLRLQWDERGRPAFAWAGRDRIPGNQDDRVARFDEAGEVVVAPAAAY